MVLIDLTGITGIIVGKFYEPTANLMKCYFSYVILPVEFENNGWTFICELFFKVYGQFFIFWLVFS